jgi:hypothetical protein
MSHQSWLESPYDHEEGLSAADEEAIEKGYRDAADMDDCLRDEANERRFEEERERRMFGNH